MKCNFLFASVVLPTLAFAAVPQVSDVAYGQVTQGSRLVTVSYQLADAPAIVTMDVRTNGTSIGAQNIRFLSGDVNRVVQPDTQNRKVISWDVEKSWPDQKIKDNSVTVHLTAWSLDMPPPYMVADLTGTNGVSYYASANNLPYGPLANDVYRTDCMVLRRIDAAGVTWTMGSVTYQGGDGNVPHDVTLTNDFYVGVFEVTQGQWKKVMGAYPGTGYTAADRDLHPVENVCFIDMRGSGAYWPAAPLAGSFLYEMRERTGNVCAFDLPSETQWEFAARANHFGDRNGDGTWYAATNQLQLAVYASNSGGHTAVVGSRKSNDWGLYDMAGNVWEWCLDWKWTDGRLATNHFGEVCTEPNAKSQVVRGGCYYNGVEDTRLARRGGANYDNRSQGSRGFRVVWVIGR